MKQYTLTMIIAAFICSIASIVSGQGTWAVLNGGSESETPYSMRVTNDGGYIQCGITNSFGLTDNDCWIIKLDSTGAMVWQKAFGGTDFDIMSGIWQTGDGGYIAAGGTWSFGAGSSDFWVVRLDASGTIVWQRVYGGTGYDFAHYAQQTSDGGYFVFGRSWSFGAGNGDFWLLKLDASGVVQWQRAYGGTNVETGYSAQQTSDGGYIVVGGTWSFGAGNSDAVVLKLDTNGNISWQKTYGGSNFDYAYSVNQTTDGGYIVAAATQSFGAGNMDCWVLKLDATGTVTWQKTYGGAAFDYLFNIQQTSDGGYIATGKTESYGAGNEDILLLKLDSTGAITYQKTYGGVSNDNGNSVVSTTNGGYAVLGNSSSYGVGGGDNFTIKVDSTLSLDAACTFFTNPSISPANTAIAGVNSSLTAATTAATVSNTAVTPLDTTAMSNFICPPAPILYSIKPQVDDSGAPVPNGIIEPDEVVDLLGSLRNNGTIVASSVTATLTTVDPVVINSANATYPDINPGVIQDCTACYSVTAPLANRPEAHWDFKVTDTPTCSACNAVSYIFTFHVGNSFTDVPSSHFFYSQIERVLHSKVTSGCTAMQYCPSLLIQRQQMAKFICRSMNAAKASTCVATGCNGIFGDVPAGNIFCADIEGLYNAGVVAGCQASPLLYCPNLNTQRQAMAKFICIAMEITDPDSCVTSACTGIFDDVPAGNPFCGYIEALYNAGVVSGCSGTSFCPASDVTREQMAKFLVNAFDFKL